MAQPKGYAAVILFPPFYEEVRQEKVREDLYR